MLKLIPQENPDPQNVASKIARSVRRAVAKRMSGNNAAGSHNHRIKKKKGRATAPKLRQKFEHGMKEEQNILHIMCVKMIRFIKKPKQNNVKDFGELIYGLQRSILSLERQRQKLVWEARRKKRDK